MAAWTDDDQQLEGLYADKRQIEADHRRQLYELDREYQEARRELAAYYNREREVINRQIAALIRPDDISELHPQWGQYVTTGTDRS